LYGCKSYFLILSEECRIGFRKGNLETNEEIYRRIEKIE
jgi:hypothetical protein